MAVPSSAQTSPIGMLQKNGSKSSINMAIPGPDEEIISSVPKAPPQQVQNIMKNTVLTDRSDFFK